MADIIDKGYPTSSNSSTIPKKFRDLGDGTYALDILVNIYEELQLQTNLLRTIASATAISLVSGNDDLVFSLNVPTIFLEVFINPPFRNLAFTSNAIEALVNFNLNPPLKDLSFTSSAPTLV